MVALFLDLPQTYAPATRIAPNPSRFTVRSPRVVIVPAAAGLFARLTATVYIGPCLSGGRQAPRGNGGRRWCLERDRPERRMDLDSVFAPTGESGRVHRGDDATVGTITWMGARVGYPPLAAPIKATRVPRGGADRPVRLALPPRRLSE